MQKKIYIIIVALFLVSNLRAQKDRYSYTKKINFRIGAQSSFQTGSQYEGIFSTDRQSLQGQTFLGYQFDRSEQRFSYLGIWASMGNLNKGSIADILKENNLNLPANFANSKGSQWEVQLGVILDEWFSLSAGAGSMHIPLDRSFVNRNYYIVNGGLIFGRGPLNLVLNHSLLFGGDLQKTALRFGTGLLFNFKIINGKKR